MQTMVLLLLIPAVALGGLFFLVWRLDARRADRQDNDPERRDVDPSARPGRGKRRA